MSNALRPLRTGKYLALLWIAHLLPLTCCTPVGAADTNVDSPVWWRCPAPSASDPFDLRSAQIGADVVNLSLDSATPNRLTGTLIPHLSTSAGKRYLVQQPLSDMTSGNPQKAMQVTAPNIHFRSSGSVEKDNLLEDCLLSKGEVVISAGESTRGGGKTWERVSAFKLMTTAENSARKCQLKASTSGEHNVTFDPRSRLAKVDGWVAAIDDKNILVRPFDGFVLGCQNTQSPENLEYYPVVEIDLAGPVGRSYSKGIQPLLRPAPQSKIHLSIAPSGEAALDSGPNALIGINALATRLMQVANDPVNLREMSTLVGTPIKAIRVKLKPFAPDSSAVDAANTIKVTLPASVQGLAWSLQADGCNDGTPTSTSDGVTVVMSCSGRINPPNTVNVSGDIIGQAQLQKKPPTTDGASPSMIGTAIFTESSLKIRVRIKSNIPSDYLTSYQIGNSKIQNDADGGFALIPIDQPPMQAVVPNICGTDSVSRESISIIKFNATPTSCVHIEADGIYARKLRGQSAVCRAVDGSETRFVCNRNIDRRLRELGPGWNNAEWGGELPVHTLTNASIRAAWPFSSDVLAPTLNAKTGTCSSQVRITSAAYCASQDDCTKSIPLAAATSRGRSLPTLAETSWPLDKALPTQIRFDTTSNGQTAPPLVWNIGSLPSAGSSISRPELPIEVRTDLPEDFSANLEIFGSLKECRESGELLRSFLFSRSEYKGAKALECSAARVRIKNTSNTGKLLSTCTEGVVQGSAVVFDMKRLPPLGAAKRKLLIVANSQSLAPAAPMVRAEVETWLTSLKDESRTPAGDLTMLAVPASLGLIELVRFADLSALPIRSDAYNADTLHARLLSMRFESSQVPLLAALLEVERAYGDTLGQVLLLSGHGIPDRPTAIERGLLLAWQQSGVQLTVVSPECRGWTDHKVNCISIDINSPGERSARALREALATLH